MNKNADPTAARKARRAKRKPPGMEQLMLKLWKAMETAEDLLNHDDPNVRLRATHAMATVAGTYTKAKDVGELEARLSAVEEQMKDQDGAA